MRKRLILMVLLSAQSCAWAQVAPQATSWTAEEMMKTKTVGGVQVSADGRRVVFTVTEAVMSGDKSEMLTQIWVASADGAGAVQFTRGDKSSTSPQWSPDGQWIAFLSPRAERNQVWLIRADGGEAEQLSTGQSAVSNFAWSPDGKWIAYTMMDPASEAEEKSKKEKSDMQVVDENFKMNRLWVMPVEESPEGKRDARLLTKGEYSVATGGPGGGGYDWSPDGKTIVFAHTPTARVNDWTLSDISTVEVATGEVKPLVASKAAESSPIYSPDGRRVAYTASDTPPSWGFNFTTYVVQVGSGPPRELAATFDRQPGLIGWSGDGKWIYFSETRGTVTRIAALPADGGAPQDISSGELLITGINLNRNRSLVGFTAQASDRPPEAYVAGLDQFAPVQVSRVQADLPKFALGRTEVVRWKSKDSTPINGLLTYPVGYQKGKRYPLLVIVHGGPAGVFTQSFIAGRSIYPIAAFAAQGYAVLRPNPRGSSGYGKNFRYANYKDWGGGDYQDILTGVDTLIESGLADPQRLGVMGWSYGGFMTSWTITQTKRFQAASVGAGVTNLVSFTGTADIPGFIPDYMGAEFWDNLDIYVKHSAMYNVRGVTTPTLILHGERDDRVPISQGYEFYNALRRQGVTVQMVTYPRTPHGPQEPKFILDIAKRNLEWFGKFVSATSVTGN